jgi:hypothetical protein
MNARKKVYDARNATGGGGRSGGEAAHSGFAMLNFAGRLSTLAG